MKHALLAFTLFLLASSAAAASALRWEYRLMGSATTDLASEGDTVYVGTSSGNLLGLNMTTGRHLMNDSSTAGIYSTPTIHGDRLIFGCDNGILYSINRFNGSRIWSYKAEGRVRASPSVDGGRVYFGSEDGHLISLQAATGKLNWRFYIASPVMAGALADGWKIFTSSSDKQVWAISNTTYLPLWNRTVGVINSKLASYNDLLIAAADKRILALDKFSGKTVWNISANGTIVGPPTVYGNEIIFSSSDKRVHSVDAVSGAEKWSAAMNDSMQSPPTVCDGTIYVGGSAGIHALDEKTGKIQWVINTSSAVRSRPACSTGMVVVSVGQFVRAYGGSVDVAVANITVSPAKAAASRPLSLDVTVANLGSVMAADVDVAVYLDRMNVSRSQVTLDANETKTIRTKIAASYGRHLAEASLDEGGRLVESDRDNNRMSFVFSTFAEWPTYMHDFDRTGYLDLSENFTSRIQTLSWSCNLDKSNRTMANSAPLWDVLNSTKAFSLRSLQLNHTCTATQTRGYPLKRLNSTWTCMPYNSSVPEKTFRRMGDYVRNFNESEYNLSMRRGSFEYPFNLTGFIIYFNCTASSSQEIPMADSRLVWDCRLREGNITPYNLTDAFRCAARYLTNYSLEELAQLKNGGKNAQPPFSGAKIGEYGLLWKFTTGGIVDSSPAMGDLDRNGEGQLVTVFGSRDGYVYALDPNGNPIWKTYLNSSVTMTAISDPEDTGAIHVLAGTVDGHLVYMDSYGLILWEFPANGSILAPPLELSTGDTPQKNLIFGSKDGRVYAIDYRGRLQWSYQTSDAITASPSKLDIDGDGKPEVLIGSADNILYALRTPPYKVWMFQTNGDVSTPKPARTYPYGGKDVIAASTDGNIYDLTYGLAASDEGARKCGPEGCGQENIPKSKLSLRWNFTADGPIASSPAVLDANHDGRIEIYSASTEGSLYAINSTGDRLMKATLGGPIYSTPAAADLDGDGSPELIFGSDDGNIYIVNASGWNMFEYHTGGFVRSSPAIGDINGDGRLEFAVGSYDGGLYMFGVTSTTSTTQTSTTTTLSTPQTTTSSMQATTTSAQPETTSSTATTTSTLATMSATEQKAMSHETIISQKLSPLLIALTLVMGLFFCIILMPPKKPKPPSMSNTDPQGITSSEAFAKYEIGQRSS